MRTTPSSSSFFYSFYKKFHRYYYLWNLTTPRVGFEPTTLRLTAECSTTELSRIMTLLFKELSFYSIICCFLWIYTKFLIFPYNPFLKVLSKTLQASEATHFFRTKMSAAGCFQSYQSTAFRPLSNTPWSG